MFDDIRPYSNAEIPAAMHRIAAHPSFPVLASFVFPDRDVEEVRQQIAAITDITDFQHHVMNCANRQIIELTKAMIRNAKVVVMDEPTAAITMAEQEKLYKVVKQLKEDGITVIYISHRLEEIMDICDSIAVLSFGVLIADGTPKERLVFSNEYCHHCK